MLLLCQVAHRSQLVRAAVPHLFLCAAALYVPRASAACSWRGSRAQPAALLGGAVFLECCFLGRETLGRETTVAHTITQHP
jgi:hypothetical protein